MNEGRFRRLRNYRKDLELERKKFEEEEMKKHQRTVEVFSPKIEAICKEFAKGIEWKYEQWKEKHFKLEEWKCAVIEPGFFKTGRIVISLWASGWIQVGRGVTIPLDVDSGTFNENALIEALEEEYKGIVRHGLYLKRLYSKQ